MEKKPFSPQIGGQSRRFWRIPTWKGITKSWPSRSAERLCKPVPRRPWIKGGAAKPLTLIAMSYPKYVPIITNWTEEELEEYNVEYKFTTYEQFFGQKRIIPQFDINIFDINLVEKRDEQKVETINFFMHHNAHVMDEGGLTDYAFALLWFTGYIATPRHAFRNVLCKYGYQGTSSYINYNLTLQCGLKTVLFVVVADSVIDGVSKVLAGALSLSTQYHERRHNYPVRTT